MGIRMGRRCRGLVVVLICCIMLVGCVGKAGEGGSNDRYSEYMIMGMTESGYINTIKNSIKLAYSPKRGVTREQIEKTLSRYMADNVVERLMEGDGGKGEVATNVVTTIKDAKMFYGKHQNDGVTSLVVAIRVETTRKYWDITLEFFIGRDGIIHDIGVY